MSATAEELVELARGATEACEERLRADATLATDPDAQRRLGSAIGRLASAELLTEEITRCADADPVLSAAMRREVARLAKSAVEAILADAGDAPAVLAAAHAMLDLDSGPDRRGDDELLRELARRRFASD
jgi:hypothetical protein